MTPHVLSEVNVEWCSLISMCSCSGVEVCVGFRLCFVLVLYYSYYYYYTYIYLYYILYSPSPSDLSSLSLFLLYNPLPSSFPLLLFSSQYLIPCLSSSFPPSSSQSLPLPLSSSSSHLSSIHLIQSIRVGINIRLFIFYQSSNYLTPHVLSDGNVEWCSLISMCSCLKF